MMIHRTKLLASAAVAALLLPAAAFAQETPDGQDEHHVSDEIVVTGVVQRNKQDVLSGVAIVQGGDLAAATRPSIGETLASVPGVSATSFGPSASRPVLRGLQGERVRVLTDGIGAIDVSNTSVDHAVVVNPLLAERIEVLRGPQSLLYGSSAIGGVVNVIDRRIPTKLQDEPFHLGAIGTYGSAANERSTSAAADVKLGGGFVFHADGSWSKSDDLRIGGYALTPALRAQALASSRLPKDPASDVDFAANAALAAGAAQRALPLLDLAHTDALAGNRDDLTGEIAIDRARALVALGRSEEASIALAEARAKAPDNPQGWLLSATLARRQGKLAEAQPEIEMAAKLLPGDGEIGLEAGVIAVLGGRDAAARQSWQSVIAAAPGSDAARTAKSYLDQLGPPPPPSAP